MYEIRKTYGHNLGFSCCFRQWAALSHCRFMHGYSIKIVLVFRGWRLDHRNWLVDFGGLKEIKKYLEDTFDHKTLVAENDPDIETFKEMHKNGIIQMVQVTHVGMEGFAKKISDDIKLYNRPNVEIDRSLLKRVEVWEHEGNMAAYEEGM